MVPKMVHGSHDSPWHSRASVAPRIVHDNQDMASKNFHSIQDNPWHPRQPMTPKSIYGNEDYP